jgi:hypothetical protein
MTEALKELFNAYKNLPVGVIFFKQKQLFFVNEHLRHILLLGSLPGDDVAQIIGSMLNLENPSHLALHSYLSENDFFWYRDRIVQIEHSEYEDMTIIVFTRLNDQTIEAVDSLRSLRQMREKNNLLSKDITDQDIPKLLTQKLGDYAKAQIPSVVLYKGIPIKGNIWVKAIENNHIRVLVEKKQLIASQNGVEWLFGFKRDAMISSTVSGYDLSTNEVTLTEMHPVSHGFHQRALIRYHADNHDSMSMKIKGKEYRFTLRNLSEKGVAVESDNSEALSALSTLGAKAVYMDITVSSKPIKAMATWLYTVPLDEGRRMKVVFMIQYDAHNAAVLQEWLNAQQLQLIKEVRSFIQMLPVSTVQTPPEWVI